MLQIKFSLTLLLLLEHGNPSAPELSQSNQIQIWSWKSGW